MLLGANLTLSKSDATLQGATGRRSIDLPNQSDTVGNFMVGWENDRFNMRLAANYKSGYLLELGPSTTRPTTSMPMTSCTSTSRQATS